jgi:tetratricopeptide (TPR) repeat protein
VNPGQRAGHFARVPAGNQSGSAPDTSGPARNHSKTVPEHREGPMSDWKSEWKRGMDLFRKKQHQDAVEAYRSALALEPDRLEVLHSLSVALMHAGELDRAIEIGNRIVELDKNDPFAHTSLSIFYQRKGMIPEAEAEAAKARVKAWRQELKTNPKAPPPKDVTDLDVIQ